MTDLITGASGFIGGRLAARLAQAGGRLRLLVRSAASAAPTGAEQALGALEDPAALAAAAAGARRVFHCAGYAHAEGGRSNRGQARDAADAEAARHWAVNHDGAIATAAAAAEAGAEAFVFLSSVKAMGPPPRRGRGAPPAPLDEEGPGAPETPYGAAKRAAEAQIHAIGQAAGMRTIALRPCVVYGAGGRGNMTKLAQLIARGVFPPPPETGNRRSFVHVADMVDALLAAAEAGPEASGAAYIIAHPEAVSGRQLYDAVRAALELPPRRAAVPYAAFAAGAAAGDALGAVSGRSAPLNSLAMERLFGDAWYDPSRAEQRLGWRARVSLAEGLREMRGAAVGERRAS